MPITGTHFNYFFVCKRKLWLFANGITMEHTSDVVYEGKLIHETAYPQRSERYQEIEIGGIKIDFYDPVNRVVHEIKKTDKIEDAHELQVKYYILTLERFGVENVSGILEYPELRKTSKVILSEADRIELGRIEKEIQLIIGNEICPKSINSKICKNCSYYDFCYATEEEKI